jgi:hypothetical protein
VAAEKARPCLDLLTDLDVDWPPDPPAEATRHVALAQGLARTGDLDAAFRAVTEAETIARAANLNYEHFPGLFQDYSPAAHRPRTTAEWTSDIRAAMRRCRPLSSSLRTVKAGH